MLSTWDSHSCHPLCKQLLLSVLSQPFSPATPLLLAHNAPPLTPHHMLCTLCSVAAMSAAARAMDRTTTGRISLLDFSEHVAPRAALAGGAGAAAGGREQQRVGVGASSQPAGSTPECTISTTAASLLLRGQVDPLYADTVSGALLLHTLLAS